MAKSSCPMVQNAPPKFLDLTTMTMSSIDMLAEELEPQPPLTVCLVLKDRGWILEKMAICLAENLAEWNIAAQISYFPSSKADINHWMLYYDLEGRWYGKNTLAITHVDRPAKLHILRQRLKKADIGICVSRMTLEQLVSSGIPRQKLCYITPARNNTIKPKRIVIGITSQIRPDGAKRESVLIQMAQAIRLDLFHFEIVGPNWEKVIPYFQAAGATVDWDTGAYQKDNEEHLQLVLERLNRFDYYLYMGWDEGSMGFFDALAAGIPTIVTPQGFHLDINGGITYPFTDAPELCAIFEKLASERQHRIDSVSGLTWNEYARQHAIVWHALADGQQVRISALLHGADRYSTPLSDPSRFNWRGRDPQVNTKDNLFDFFLLWEFYTNTKFQNTLLWSFAKLCKDWLFKAIRRGSESGVEDK